MLKNKKMIISLGVNIIIVLLAIFVFGTKLFMEDDCTLSYMCFGILTKASSRTYYTNVVLGWLYKRLFSVIPGFNWQTFIFYCGLLFSGTVGLYYVLRQNNKRLIILWSLFEIVFFHDIYVYLTFSVVAAYIAYQGYLALFFSVKEEKVSVWLYVTSGIAIVLSSMIRIDSFLGASGFAFFIWIILAIVNYKKNGNIRALFSKFFYPFAVIIGVCFAFLAVDRVAYLKGDWKVYHDYEKARLSVTDYRNSVMNQDFEVLNDMGISESQAYAILEWRSNDPEIFTNELVERMGSTTRNYNYLTSPYVWRDFWGQWKVLFTSFGEVYFSLLMFIYLLFSMKKECYKEKIMCFFLLIPFLAELFYFAYMGRMDDGVAPERCVYIVLMGLVVGVISIYDAFDSIYESNKKISQGLLVALVIAAIIIQPTQDFSVNGLGLVDVRELEKEYGYLGNGEKIYVAETTIPQKVARDFGAWQVPSAGFMDQCIDIGNWLTKHPMQNELQKSLGCENPYRALYGKENVYYITENGTQGAVLDYLHENYDERITMEYIKEKGDFKVFKYHLE